MSDYTRDYAISYGNGSCSITFTCFDTRNMVTVFDRSKDYAALETTLVEVRNECLDLHLLWSFSLPESDITRINTARKEVEVDERTASLLRAMKDFNACEPLFDFTIGPVSYLWKHATHVPDETTLAQAARHVGSHLVRVEGTCIAKDDPLVQVDVGGAAKGYAADMAASILHSAGYACADIDLGGNLFLMGAHPEGRPWRLGVKVPEGSSAQPNPIELTNASAVTSGTYERFVELDGTRYHHIIDPRTLHPSTSDIVSCTAIGPSSLQADMLATTALLGGSSGLEALAKRHPGYKLVAITDTGRSLIVAKR